jgi:hypothetical protein
MTKWVVILACVVWILLSIVEPNWIIAITGFLASLARNIIEGKTIH